MSVPSDLTRTQSNAFEAIRVPCNMESDSTLEYRYGFREADTIKKSDGQVVYGETKEKHYAHEKPED